MAEATVLRGAIHLPEGEGSKVWVVGDTYTFKTRGPDTNGAFTIFEGIIPPGGGPPPHVHQREDEVFYVLDGKIGFVADDRRFTGTVGSYVHIPPGTLHWWKNVGTTDARMLIFFTPGGISEFFFGVGQPVVTGETAPSLGPEEIERTLEFAPRYGMDVRFRSEPPGT